MNIENQNIKPKFRQTYEPKKIETEKIQISEGVKNENPTYEKFNDSRNDANYETTLQQTNNINEDKTKPTTSIDPICKQLNILCDDINDKEASQQTNNAIENKTTQNIQPSTSKEIPEEKQITVLSSVILTNSSNIVPLNPKTINIEQIFIHEHSFPSIESGYEEDPLNTNNSNNKRNERLYHKKHKMSILQ